jgi:hypothetical protein
VNNVAENVQINLVLEQGADKKRVVTQAVAAGLAIEQELDALGIITGSGPGDIVEKLRAIPGVSSVERGREVKIPPPGSPIQ